jgi:acyl-coenzyme A thioesterase PaaI-like protein
MSDAVAPEPAPIPDGYTLIDWTRGFGRSIGPLYQKSCAVEGYARAFRVEDRHTNGMMNAHGGMLMSFADVALGHAVSGRRDRWWVTVRLCCDFVSGAHLGDWVEGNGRIIASADDLHTVEGRIWVGDRTVMTATGVFKTIERRPTGGAL